MKGSDKQVRWAEDIKRQAIVALAQFCDTEAPQGIAQAVKAGKMSEATATQQTAAIERIVSKTVDRLNAQEEASWWIDRRGNLSARQWMREVWSDAEWQAEASK